MMLGNPPFKAWHVRKSGAVAEILLTGRAAYAGYYTTPTGGMKHNLDLFPSKAEAVAEGKLKLRRQQERLDVQLANLKTKLANLEKSAATEEQTLC